MRAASEVLHFWFTETSPAQHWTQSDAFDAKVRTEFETTAIDAAAKLKQFYPHPWESAADTHLALIVMLDQFPRNMYRGTPGAFAWDEIALSVSRRGIDKGHDLKTPMARRAFFYMPFMHSESLADQEDGLFLFESRLEDESSLFHAKAHAALIRKFGRFPHRNAILGRESTEAEQAHLSSGGYQP